MFSINPILIVLILLNIYYRRQSKILDRLESTTYKYNLFTEKLAPKPELKIIDLEVVLKEYNLLKALYYKLNKTEKKLILAFLIFHVHLLNAANET